MVSNVVARRCAMFFFALSVCVAGARHITEAHAAGAIAVGKCGAYGQAYDYGAEHEARAAAQKQCKGDCTTVTMKRACAAMSVDMANPCGAYGYAVKPKISATLDAATRECYKFGGKECVIRAWACDAKGRSKGLIKRVDQGLAQRSSASAAIPRRFAPVLPVAPAHPPTTAPWLQ